MPPYAATVLLLFGASGAWYASAYALVDAADEESTGGGRRGILTAIPAVILAIGAAAMGRAEVAVAASFSAAAAAASLALGATLASAPRGAIAPTGGRGWAFLLPAALITLIAGFTGRLTWLHALCLLIEGTVVAGVWADRRKSLSEDKLPLADRPKHVGYKVAQIALAAVLAGVGAWLAVAMVGRAESAVGRPAGVPVGSLFGLILVLPAIGLGGQLAARGKLKQAAGAQVSLALACLCLALPAGILTAYARAAVVSTSSAATTRPVSALSNDIPTVVFPPSVWRVDAMFLVILGLALIPASAGRLRLGRGVGLALVLAYIVFINLVARTH